METDKPEYFKTKKIAGYNLGNRTDSFDIQDDLLQIGRGPGVAHRCALSHQDAASLYILSSWTALLHGFKHIESSLKSIQDKCLSCKLLNIFPASVSSLPVTCTIPRVRFG
ncbi:hypothetical protein E2C01_008844 [Portunus trituberculatus]|uniref:Uncharacterized protein n=1 Tax=Portunus trituberculatus TaxID=210409 RepID=A0A5B7D3Z8_PORTR|nr:hypothetical protein [Portunus trituberculatus]